MNDPIEIKQRREEQLDEDIERKNAKVVELTRQVNLLRQEAERVLATYIEAVRKAEKDYLTFLEELYKK